jgi:hypothetical protein
MPPLDAFLPSVAIGLILFVMLWFALGTQRNIRTGNELLRWLQGGLPILGRRTTLRWLGSSAVELEIAEPVGPFRKATVVVVLEPRDSSVLWAYARWRGRRDFVIVRVDLVRPPRSVADIRDPLGWTNRSDSRADGAGLTTVHDADPAIRTAWQRLSDASGGVWRLTVQPVIPHLEVHLRPPALDAVGADRILGPIGELAESLARR